MNEDYYKKQIKGLMLIVADVTDEDNTIHRNYILEKLRMILKGGINFHPTILEALSTKEECSVCYYKNCICKATLRGTQ